MYVCHCNAIPERDILTAIDRLTAHGVAGTVTAGKVLLELDRYGKCLGCFPLIEDLLAHAIEPGKINAPRQAAKSHPARMSSMSPPPEPSPQERSGPDTRRPRRRGGSLARRSS